MSTETTAAPTAPVAPATPISARPPTPVNPTSQKRPAAIQPPTTNRPPSNVMPDMARANQGAMNDALKKGIEKIWNPEKAAAAQAATKAAEITTPGTPPTPILTEQPPHEHIIAPLTNTPSGEVAKPAPEAIDRFADIVEPEGISEAGKKGWKALKTKADSDIKAAEKRLADAEAQLSTLRKATPAETADTERLREEHKNALDRLAVMDLQNHPDFTRQYSEPKARAIADAAEVLAYNNKPAIDPILLGKSQKDFNAAVAEMTQDMNSMDATTIQTAMRSAYKIANDEKAALSQAGDLRAGIEAKNAMQTKQAFEEVYGSLGFENLITPKEAPAESTAEQRAEVAQYNEALSKTRSMAEKNAFGRLSPKDAAAVATKAAYLDVMVQHVMPVLEKGYSAVVAERNALAKELQAIKGLKAPGSFNAPAEADTGEKKDANYYLRQAYGKK